MIEFRYLYSNISPTTGTIAIGVNGVIADTTKPRLQYRITYKVTEHVSGDILLTKRMHGDMEPQWMDIPMAFEA